MRIVLAVVVSVVMIGSPAGATVPPYFPSRLAHVGDARQVIVVTGRGMGSSYATVRAYALGDGGWRESFPEIAARIGYAGWQWAAKRVQNTGTTPIGTFPITEAFGLAADPGTRVPYRRVDGNDYWVGDRRDPRTYNMFQPAASGHRTWRISQAERLASYPKQYEYVAVIDFNRPSPASIRWDPARGEYVTAKPAVAGRGSAVFLHVSGTGSTAGCVSLSRPDMIGLLRWLNPDAHPRIVMAPIADIGRA